jgi:DNA polymerase-3 subunit delta'
MSSPLEHLFEHLFNDLIGQPQAVELLTRAIAQNRIAPAYLFTGASGIGRSVAARCFAQRLLTPPSRLSTSDPPTPLCRRIQQGNHPDLLWVEPTYLHQGKRISAAEAAALGVKRRSPPEIRLEQIRDIARFLSRPPLEAPRSVVVVEQAETMAEAAANGLLKTLEEPGRATLILIAPSADALLPTLVSRCQRIPFQRLDAVAMRQVLNHTNHAEILQRPDIIALAQGSPGAAIAHWQQLQTIPSALLSAATHQPTSLRESLDLARQITQTLDVETQLWLLDYLQHHYWHQQGRSNRLQQLETARRQLLQFVQPRLVWEVMLGKMREQS